MTMSIVHGSPGRMWIPVKPGATMYVGGIACFDSDAQTDQGAIMMGTAVGIANITNLDVPFGIVVGTNNMTPVYDSTYKTEKITAVAAGSSHGDTTDYMGVEGPFAADGKRRAMVEVDLINPSTLIKSSLYGATQGTAPTLLTATAISTDGLGTTTNATQCTPVADVCTCYCRTGNNAGQYRILDTTSTTVHTWTQAMWADIAVGDTFVIVPVLPAGLSYVQTIATSAAWLDITTQAKTTNYFTVHVTKLDLAEAGKEYAIFRFDGDNFNTVRA